MYISNILLKLKKKTETKDNRGSLNNFLSQTALIHMKSFI